jgi:hypothetical protein
VPPIESPFREEDLQARVDALRAQRAELVWKLEEARAKPGARSTWSWGWFLLGVVFFPAMLAVLGLLVAR